MKKQIKVLALAITILSITACGADKAKQTNYTSFGQGQIVAKNETSVANVKSPKTDKVKIKKPENKIENKKAYLIPQTLEAKERESIEETSEENLDQTNQEEIEVAYEEETTQTYEYIDNVDQDTYTYDDSLAKSDESYQLAYEDDLEIDDDTYQDYDIEVGENVDYLADSQDYDDYDILAYDDQEDDYLAYDMDNEAQPYQVLGPEAEVMSYEMKEEAEAEIIEEENIEEPIETEASKEEVKPANETGLTFTSPSEQEVRAYWKNYQTKATDTKDYLGIKLINPYGKDVYKTSPNLDKNNISLGSLSEAAQLDALHIANTARFAAGIKNEMILGIEQAKYAQASSLLNRLNGQISHSPANAGLDQATFSLAKHGAENSNLGQGLNILDAVVNFLRDDLGEANQNQVGHRRWVLNPVGDQVGFGQVDDYTSMYVNNGYYADENTNAVFAYPSETAISELHSNDSSLSLMFGENFEISNAKVTVTDLETGQTSKEAHIDQGLMGCVKAITFGRGMNYAPGTKLKVKVEGVRVDGYDYPIEYTITYMSLN